MLRRLVNGVLMVICLSPLSVSSHPPEAGMAAPWFSPQEIDWIKRHPVINVAMESNSPPYSLLSRDGEMIGLDADILQRIAEKSGLSFNVIPASGPQAIAALLLNGKAQMTPAQSGGGMPSATLLLSEPWDMLEWVMITRNEHSAPVTLQPLSPLRVAIPRGYPLHVARRLYPQLSIVEVDSALQAVEMMLAGAADAAFTTIGSARYLQASRYGDRIIVRLLDNAREPERFAVAASQPQLLTIVNKSLAIIPPQELRALRNHWFSLASLTVAEAGLPPWVKLWGSALLLIALSSVFWGSYLARQVRRRRQAEYRLQELLAYRETLFNNVPTPLFVCAPDMTITAANRYFCQAMALTLPQVVGHPLFSLHFLPTDEQQAVRSLFLRCLAGDLPHFVDRQMLLQGEAREGYLWFEGYRNPAGVVQGVIGGWFDVTERKSLARELLLARDNAQQASDEKSAFLARMSHEIRTPLHAIIGILELAVKQHDDPALQLAWQAAESLQGVVGDVLDFSRIEAGGIELTPQPVQLAALLANCAATFRPRAQEKGLTLQSELLLPDARHYLLDSVRLMQVINNLLLNAIKFTAEGGIWLRARHVGQTQQEGDEIMIEVEDSGCGIAPEHYQAVMQPWVREESAATVPGSGLGLPIAARLIALMGGTLVLNESAAGGVRATITLRLAHAAPQVPAIPAVMPAAGESLNILVVDDLAVNLQVLALQFAASEHYVELVSSGAEALQEVAQHYYDMVLTDCQMQGMDGYALTRQLRADQQQRQLPPYIILGCTANAFASEHQRCLAAGMDGVLTKPLTRQGLLEGVAQAWQRANRTPAEGSIPLNTLAQGDSQQQQQLLSALLTGLQQDSTALRGALCSDDREHIAQLAHRLHATFALLNDQAGMRVCLRIEKSARFDAQTVQTLLTRAEQAVSRISASITE